tara:strand:+ start:2296 stop:3330 length:1035 start_codon:yes stop_codon:yes gene_type:complete
MKRIEYIKYGGPEVLQVQSFDLEEPKQNEIQIKTHFAGINFAEIMTRMGLYPGAPKPPSSIGGEASGEIIKIGEDVEGFNIGDKIMCFAPFNSYSSHINVNHQMVMKLPENYNAQEGAAFPVIYVTAYMMMFHLGNLKKNEYFFIQGAGGGVGTAAIQLAKSIGAIVIGSSSGWKHEKLKQLGCDYCIDYNKESAREQIMKYTNNYGVDLIIDPVGGKEWKESYKSLSPMGKLIVYGNQNMVSGNKRSAITMLKEYFSMPKIKPFEMIGSNKAVMGYHLGKLKGAEHKIQIAIDELNEIVKKNDNIKPVISKVFPYTEVAKAHQYIQNRKNFGKVLLDFSMSEK